MIRIGVILLIFMACAPARADEVCVAAAHRVVGFLKEEAKGTRHEAQIADSIKAKGEGPAAAEIAAKFEAEQCAFLLVAPDSTIRALAISMLPERNGQ